MTPGTIANRVSLSMGFSRQEYWSGGHALSPPGDLPHPGIKLGSPALQADSLTSEPPGKQGSTQCMNGNKQFLVKNGEKETRVTEGEMVK